MPSRRLFGLPILALTLAAPLSAQSEPANRAENDSIKVYEIDPVVVTATRGPRLVSQTPRPVSVIGPIEIQELSPNSVSDLFRRLPGLDVTGVGPNQARPSIRGQRGQRILLLQDGMRLNNSRRQQDFGELPAIVDVTGVEKVEIVRGPASVLYGSDAIGGVVNVITRAPRQEGLSGFANFRYGDVEGQRKGTVRLFGRFDQLDLQVGYTRRDADAYQAPEGDFGDITLANDVEVENTGVQDENIDFRVGWSFSDQFSVFGKLEQYTAEEAGFGNVRAENYDPTALDITILYPNQEFRKFTFGVRAEELGSPLADRFELTAYQQQNERDFSTGLSIPISFPGSPPGARVDVLTENFTDIRSLGIRAEARKLVAPKVLLTYGVDAFRDRAEGTDLSTSTTIGFGPPQVDVDNTPALPDARFLNAGAFLQAEVEVTDRFSLVGGGRFTHIEAETFATAGLEALSPVDASDNTFVAAVNGLYQATPALSFVGSVGQAFRAPNLVERFFEGGATGGAFQVANPELAPERSLNVDLGLRFRQPRFGLELFAFRNNIDDGIRIAALPDPVNGQPAFQNVNVDELRFQGVEIGGDVRVGGGVTLLASYTWLDTEDVNDPENPVGDAFSSKTTATVRYDHPGNRFWVQWDSRFQGEQREVDLVDNPVGDVFPSFNVHHLRGGVRLFEFGGVEHQLNVAVTNLTDQLYSEATNTAFFRPEMKRNVTLGYQVAF